MFNINTIKILIVHVEVEFNWNHILKIWMNPKKKVDS